MRTFFLPIMITGLLLPLPAIAAYNPEHKADSAFERLDKDGDGKVDKHEYMHHIELRFMQIDTDLDDLISKEEMRAYWKMKKKEYQTFKDRYNKKHK